MLVSELLGDRTPHSFHSVAQHPLNNLLSTPECSLISSLFLPSVFPFQSLDHFPFSAVHPTLSRFLSSGSMHSHEPYIPNEYVYQENSVYTRNIVWVSVYIYMLYVGTLCPVVLHGIMINPRLTMMSVEPRFETITISSPELGAEVDIEMQSYPLPETRTLILSVPFFQIKKFETTFTS